MFEKIKKYYQTGVWELRKVKDAVAKGVISLEQFTEITGKVYEAA